MPTPDLSVFPHSTNTYHYSQSYNPVYTAVQASAHFLNYHDQQQKYQQFHHPVEQYNNSIFI
jgi:hypothetical protein